MTPYGYDAEKLIAAIWTGTGAMVKNDGAKTNEEVFWDTFAKVLGERVLDDKEIFEEFYRVDFQNAKVFCGFNAGARRAVSEAKEAGFRTALATNPIFPYFATESRIRWAGLEVEDFEFYTSYENVSFSKPNLKYYEAVLSRLGLEAEECLMVGNDADEDMTAEKLGMKVFLLTDCLINRSGADISRFEHGGFERLSQYIKEIKA